MAYSILYRGNPRKKVKRGAYWIWILILLGVFWARLLQPQGNALLQEALFGQRQVFTETSDGLRDAVEVFYEELLIQ